MPTHLSAKITAKHSQSRIVPRVSQGTCADLLRQCGKIQAFEVALLGADEIARGEGALITRLHDPLGHRTCTGLPKQGRKERKY